MHPPTAPRRLPKLQERESSGIGVGERLLRRTTLSGRPPQRSLRFPTRTARGHRTRFESLSATSPTPKSLTSAVGSTSLPATVATKRVSTGGSSLRFAQRSLDSTP